MAGQGRLRCSSFLERSATSPTTRLTAQDEQLCRREGPYLVGSDAAMSEAIVRRLAAGLVLIRPSSTRCATKADSVASTRANVGAGDHGSACPRTGRPRLWRSNQRDASQGREGCSGAWRIALSHVRWATVRRRCSSHAPPAGGNRGGELEARHRRGPQANWRRRPRGNLQARASAPVELAGHPHDPGRSTSSLLRHQILSLHPAARKRRRRPLDMVIEEGPQRGG
jgi:hypothetical protein